MLFVFQLDNIWPGYTLTSGLSRQLLDVDGLVAYTDPVQLRLAQIENSHQMELQNLQRQLQFARSVLQRYASGQPPDARDDCVCMHQIIQMWLKLLAVRSLTVASQPRQL